jgi:hypothetical protein
MFARIYIFLLLIPIGLSAQQLHFFNGLRGWENPDGNVTLFYRVNTLLAPPGYGYFDESLRRWDLVSGEDVAFFYSYAHPCSCGVGYQRTLEDYEFWQDDTSKFVGAGSEGPGGDLPFPSIYFLSDGIDRVEVHNIPTSSYTFQRLGLSQQDSLLMYASGWHDLYRITFQNNYWQGEYIGSYDLAGVAPFNDQMIFAYQHGNANGQIHLVKSTTGADSFTVVQPNIPQKYDPREFYFDPDAAHLYAILDDTLFVSADTGNTWENRAIPVNTLSVDRDTPGHLAISDQNDVYLSHDFGTTIIHYRTLPDRITALYKQSGTDTIYAATRFKIYKITPADTIVLKTLPIVGVEATPDPIIAEITLHQNYPNPFNPATTITFELPRSEEISLKIFDLSGRQVGTVAGGKYLAGLHSLTFDATGMASGVYFYRLQTAGGHTLTRKMLLLR